METDYKVKLEVFEGRLDLLLYLIKRSSHHLDLLPPLRVLLSQSHSVFTHRLGGGAGSRLNI